MIWLGAATSNSHRYCEESQQRQARRDAARSVKVLARRSTFHWADGGETKMSNLVLLCRYHHRLVHEGGFGVAIDPIGTIQFTDKQGKIIPPTDDQNLRGDLPRIIAAHVHAGLDITDQTPVPDWDGVTPDYNAVIQSMLYREQGRKPPV